jgi:hypothetical protein
VPPGIPGTSVGDQKTRSATGDEEGIYHLDADTPSISPFQLHFDQQPVCTQWLGMDGGDIKRGCGCLGEREQISTCPAQVRYRSSAQEDS